MGVKVSDRFLKEIFGVLRDPERNENTKAMAADIYAVGTFLGKVTDLFNDATTGTPEWDAGVAKLERRFGNGEAKPPDGVPDSHWDRMKE